VQNRCKNYAQRKLGSFSTYDFQAIMWPLAKSYIWGWYPLKRFESTSPSVCIQYMADSRVLELEEPPTQWRNLSKNFELINPILLSEIVASDF
ncbi:hypothetical protein GIB67_021768, partial [Kingdonia uniflora]